LNANETTAHPELLARLRLASVPGLTPRFQTRLVRALGSARAVLAASRGRLQRVRGMNGPRIDLVLTAPPAGEAAAELDFARRLSARILWPGAAGWPAGLEDLADPPLLLHAWGDAGEPGGPVVAVVGSRRASPYGLAAARRIGRELASFGATVVSGLARGIDTEAHCGCLAAGGRTVAVLGGGLARLYPPENAGLAAEIAASGGAVLSEFPFDAPPLPHNFPRRNRLLAALAQAVVVVEAGQRSGSLITADHALDLGRDVLAVPGRTDHPNTRGTHRLLREGAALCESAADVFAALGVDVETCADAAGEDRAAQAGGRSPEETTVLAALAGQERHADEIAGRVGLPSGTVLGTLSALELRDLVTRGADGRWSRT